MCFYQLSIRNTYERSAAAAANESISRSKAYFFFFPFLVVVVTTINEVRVEQEKKEIAHTLLSEYILRVVHI